MFRFAARGAARNTRRTAFTRGYSSRAFSKAPVSFKVAVGLASMAAVTWYTATTAPYALEAQSKGTGVSVEELQNHTSRETGIWVAINGDVYDLTEFVDMHPGGAKIILRYAGTNASKIFNRYHAKDVFSKFLTPESYVGPLIGELEEAEDITAGEDDPERLHRLENIPSIHHFFNISDFESVARQVIPPNAWAYYSSAADDEVSNRENHYAYHRIFFNPKVLVDVRDVDISTDMLGETTSAPFYCSAAAQAKLGHPDGELGISRGCGSEGVIQMISTVASYSFDEIMDTEVPGQSHWFQLYVTPDKQLAYNLIEQAKKRGAKGLFVTVDAPELGNREKDRKFRLNMDLDDDEDGDAAVAAQMDADVVMSHKDAGLTWADIVDFKKVAGMPVVIKGVQRVEDVVLAAEYGIDGVVLSNHGGRQLDFARSPIEVLADTMPVLKEKGLDNKIEVYIDGGVRRGTDVLKALCLGAKGVGLGRPFLYANSCHGEAGVQKAIKLLKEEIRLNMKLLGVSKVSDLTPELLDLRGLYARPAIQDYMYNSNYIPLTPPKFRDE